MSELNNDTAATASVALCPHQHAVDDWQLHNRDGAAPQAAPVAPEPFQQLVQPWLLACFGEAIASDKAERNHRFLEESLELVQACGCTEDEALQLVAYVYARPVGEPSQEVGGVMMTLAALCLAQGMDMHGAAETELARVWTMVEKIRAKQASKPKHSPLPAASAPTVPSHAETAATIGITSALYRLHRGMPAVDVAEPLEAVLKALETASAAPPAAPAAQGTAVLPLTSEQVTGLLSSAGYDGRGVTVQERADFINGIRYAEGAHFIAGPTAQPTT